METLSGLIKPFIGPEIMSKLPDVQARIAVKKSHDLQAGYNRFNNGYVQVFPGEIYIKRWAAVGAKKALQKVQVFFDRAVGVVWKAFEV